MRVIVQRVSKASVTVEEKVVGKIGKGFMLLVGFTHEDTEEDLDYCVKKVSKLRVFEDEQGKMNLALKDVNGSILSVSQFTLYGDVKNGNRPSFIQSARPEQATPLYDQFNEKLRAEGIHVETGIFGAMMDVALVNDGPTTIIIDSKNR